MSYPLATKTKGGKPIEATPEAATLAASFERIAHGYYLDKILNGDYPPEVVRALACCVDYVCTEYDMAGIHAPGTVSESAYDAALVLACFNW